MPQLASMSRGLSRSKQLMLSCVVLIFIQKVLLQCERKQQE